MIGSLGSGFPAPLWFPKAEKTGMDRQGAYGGQVYRQERQPLACHEFEKKEKTDIMKTGVGSITQRRS